MMYAPYAQPMQPVMSMSNQEDQDIAQTNPGLPKIGAGFVMLAGILPVLTSIQTLAMVRIYGPWKPAPYVLIAMGLSLAVIAPKLFTARSWAAVGSVVAACLLAVASGAWLFYSTTHGLFSLYAVCTPLAAIVAAILAGVCIPACDRATGARNRLRASGFDIGL